MYTHCQCFLNVHFSFSISSLCIPEVINTKPLVNISSYIFSIMFFVFIQIKCVRCCVILITGIRARRDSPRSVKMESSKTGIEKFDGFDISFQKMQIEDYLYEKDIQEPILGVKLDTMTTEEWKLKDCHAVGLIWLTLPGNQRKCDWKWSIQTFGDHLQFLHFQYQNFMDQMSRTVQRQLSVFLRLVRYLMTTLFLLTISRHYNVDPVLSYIVNVHSLTSKDIL